MSFSSQITALAGQTSSNATQWFNDGIKDVINRISMVNPQMLTLMSAENSTGVTSDAGQDVEAAHRILSVRRGTKVATQIAPNQRFEADDSNSLMKATNEYPKYYVLDGKLHVLPDPDATDKQYSSIVSYTALGDLTGATITNFPTEFYRLPVLYASIKVLHEKMVGYSSELPSDISLPILPVSSSDISVPVLPQAPVFQDVSVTLPTTIPSYALQTFNNPVMEDLDFAKLKEFIETEEDTELATAQVSKINAKIQKYQADSQTALSKYQFDMQNQLNLFNDANVEYQAGIQKAIQDAQLSAQKDVQEYASELKRHAGDVSVYQVKVSEQVQKYGADLNAYQVESTAIIQKFNAELQKTDAEYKWIAGQMAYLMSEYEKGLIPIQPPKEEKQDAQVQR